MAVCSPISLSIFFFTIRKYLLPGYLPSGLIFDDTKPDERYKHATRWSLSRVLCPHVQYHIWYYYDKDFLLKNNVFEKSGIGKIPLADYNWLNFFLSDQDKIDMFVLGAKAATKFLLEFEWETYKNDRTTMQVTLNKERGAAAVH